MTYIYMIITCLLSNAHITEGVSTTEGKEFFVSTPSMMEQYNPNTGYPRLVLMMQSAYNSSVRITTLKPLNKGMYINETLQLDVMVPKHFSNPSLYYGPDKATGYRWTFHLVGSMPFSLLVAMETSARQSETFSAIPVTGWGKEYYVVTLESQVSVVVMANEKRNTLSFTLNSGYENFKMTINNITFSVGKIWEIMLLPFTSYAVSTCRQLNANGSVTGSHIQGENPFGVISGNCMAVTNFQTCPGGDGRQKSANSVVEMFPPLSTWGKIYILFKATGRTSPGHFIITSSSQYNTMVAFRIDHADAKDPYEVIYIKPGQWAVKEGVYKWIHCAVSLLVVYIQSSSCLPEDATSRADGAPSMLVVVPVELFHTFYICIIPDMEMNHYLMFVVQLEHAHTIRTLYSTPESPVIARVKDNHKPLNIIDQLGTWQIYEFRINRGMTITLYSLHTRFGCYVHGQSDRSTYMHSPGFISSNINDKDCVRNMASMTEGDLVDNDCDGRVDEEIRDGINNDANVGNDPYTDEDLHISYNETNAIDEILRFRPPNTHESHIDFPDENFTAAQNNPNGPVTVVSPQGKRDADAQRDGMLTQWGEWKCTPNCSVTDMFRKRDCIPAANGRGCAAALVEYKESDCHVKRCPETCPSRHFGEECRFKCTFCTTDCNKFTGACPSCIPGFDYPESGCLLDRNAYKEWTRWECSEDCNSPYLVRKRMCKESEVHELHKRCTAPIIDMKPGVCYIGKTCYKDCPDYSWGENCNGSCQNCEEACNKFNGKCESCKPGFRGPSSSCVLHCKPYYFGKLCEGSCLEKCGADCVERINGDCEVTQREMYLMFSLLAIPVAIFVYCVVKRKQHEEELVAARSVLSLKSARSKSKQSLVSQSRSQQSIRSKASRGSLVDGRKSQTSLRGSASVKSNSDMKSSTM